MLYLDIKGAKSTIYGVHFGNLKKYSNLESIMATIIKSGIISYPHGFSTRHGGISTGIYESLNLGMNRGDKEINVKRNWQIFLTECGMNSLPFVCGKQVHGNRVAVVTAADAHNAYGHDPLIEADGFVTADRQVPVAIFTADCIPLLLTDEVNGVAGAIHCGWRSTVADIEKNAIEAMKSVGADERYIRAAIGPSIGRCCFEVGEEVVEAAYKLLGNDRFNIVDNSENPGKYMLDLSLVVRARLIQLGISPTKTEIISQCTMCNTNLYWSHRGTKGERGSQASIVMVP